MANSPMNRVIQHVRRTMLRDKATITDGQLLESFVRQRDEAALAALVHRHGSMVWGVCQRLLRSEPDAEDAFQATFLVLVRKAGTIRDREKVANWLYGVAQQTAVRARTAAGKRAVRERQVTDMPEPSVTPPDPWNDVQPVLDQELSRLPDKYRVIVVLCDLEGKTRPEVARQLGCPEGTIASRLARGRAMLAKRLARHGLGVSGGALATMLSQHAASACAPTSVVSSTINAATLLAAGQSLVPSVISVNVAGLTEGVMRAMLFARLKVIVVVLLAALGIGLMMHLALAQQPPGVETDQRDQAREGQQVSLIREWKEQITLQGHTRGVRAVAFSPDGRTLASGSSDRTAKLWDVATGKEQATLKGHSCGVGTVAFSPDGKTLASAINGSPADQHVLVKLWDVTTGTERAALKGASPCDGLGTVAFSPDGNTLASGTIDDTIKLWDVATGNEQAILQVHDGYITSVAFSPDGRTLANSDGTVKLWDVATRKERIMLQGHTSCVRSVAYSPDGKTLASASDDQTVKLWEVTTGKERTTLQGHMGIVWSLAYSPDGKTLASASEDKTVKLWDVATGKERTTLQGHTSFVRSVAYSPDGKTLASASEDQTVKLWDITAATKARSARATILAPKDLDRLWTTLAGDNAAQAYQAIGTLVVAPEQAVALVKERLRPVLEPNVQQINAWVTDLDSDQFAVREKATEELEQLGKRAEAALRKKLAAKPSVEVRQRIEQLLSKVEELTPESFRALRAVEVLEHIGSSEAKKVLETLATGAEGFRLTREATASLERLNKRVVAEK
jgi:RNA polymerase sigma factor (sigma-70 family)